MRHRKVAVQPQPFDDVGVAGREQELGRELERADHRRLRRFQRHVHYVFDSRLCHDDVERHRPPVFPGRSIEHRTLRDQR